MCIEIIANNIWHYLPMLFSAQYTCVRKHPNLHLYTKTENRFKT